MSLRISGETLGGGSLKRVMCLTGLLFLLAAGTLAQPRFGREHGLFRSKFLMKITKTDPDAEVRYTTDGSEPTAESALYSTMLSIESTLILRAAEFKEGVRTSDITTASYIFPLDVLNQPNNPEGYPSTWTGSMPADYEMDPELTGDKKLANKITQGFYSLPVLSVVTDKGNLFNKTKNAQTGGIYIYTGTSDSDGRGWERPASAELFGGPQEHNLTIDCALELHGGMGRVPEKNPKHSFRLTFKTDFGPAKLEYPVYGENYIETYNSLIIRTFYNYSWVHSEAAQRSGAQYTRDLWARSMQQRMGHPSSAGTYVHLFLNGLYWGLYNLSERIDECYGKYHFGGKKESYDVIKRESVLEAAEGNFVRWNEMMTLVGKAASDNRSYQMLIGEMPFSEERGSEVFLDVDNLIDYMLINQYMGNKDWDHHNWIAFCNRDHHTQGFRFVCWDSENTFSSATNNVLDLNNKDCPSYIFTTLMKNRCFLHRYIDRAYKHLSPGGLLSEEPALVLWDSLYNAISTALYDESARWGDYRRDVYPSGSAALYTVDNHFMTERNRLLTSFFPTRTSRLIKDLKAKGWYSDITPPAFMVNGETPESDTLRWEDTLTLSGGTFILYTADGTDPVTWASSSSGSMTASAVTYVGNNLMDALVGHEGWVVFRAILKSGTNWSPTVERRFYVTSGTGIDVVQGSGFKLQRDDMVYDLSGRRVVYGQSVNGKLPKGIYIVNGRKVLVK